MRFDPPRRRDRFFGIGKTGRPKGERPEDFAEWSRSVFQRDYDRLLYSQYFRRLKDVTQVARAEESYLYHDRMSHSMKVAQVGQRLAELALKRRNKSHPLTDVLDPWVVAAACRAHDMGHPPFGHLCEKELDDILTDDGKYCDNKIGYEGNAQSFRIVTRLAPHHEQREGLGLSRATLHAILKYPHSRDEDPEKYGYYQTEERAFEFARKRAGINGRDRPSLEAQIMDYADDLTYAIHDMTDFYKSGFIPLDTIFRESTNSKKYSGYRTNEVEDFTEYLDNLPDFEMHYSDPESLFTRLSSVSPNYDSLFTPFKGTERERQQIEQFTSSLIRWYLSAEDEVDPARIEVTEKEGRYQLWPHVWVQEEVDILRKLTEYYVIRDPKLAAQQEGERRLIRELFDCYTRTQRSTAMT